MGRILHLIDELQVGGAQTHLVTFLQEFRRSGRHQHEVWALFEDGPIRSQLEDLDLPARSLALRPHFVRRRYDRVVSRLHNEIRTLSPDVVEAHLTWSRFLGLWAAWRAGVPRRIGFEQGDIYLNSIPFRLANFAGQHLAHRIVVCSRALGDWVHATHRVSRKRLKVLHNCVNTDRFHPTNRAPREASWPTTKTLFCAVGTLGLGVNKRMDICIRAVAEARRRGEDVGLVICGDGRQRPALESLIHDLELRDAVRILGMRDDVPRIVASCDAFCHSAVFEPFGIVCIEAMASGLPVIVPDAGGIGEAVDHDVTGWIYPVLDEKALADRMVALHDDPTLRAQMGTAARQVAVARFGVPQYVERLEKLYALES